MDETRHSEHSSRETSARRYREDWAELAWRLSSQWYRAPATSRVTGLAMPMSISCCCISGSSPSPSASLPLPARVPRNFSASATISCALAIKARRSRNASSSALAALRCVSVQLTTILATVKTALCWRIRPRRCGSSQVLGCANLSEEVKQQISWGLSYVEEALSHAPVILRSDLFLPPQNAHNARSAGGK